MCLCNICEKNLTKNNKGVPCSNCKCKLHVKCSKTNLKDFHLYKGNWKCEKCLTNIFPFTHIDEKLLHELKFNSGLLNSPKRKFKPETTVDEKLKLMLSYSKQSPWYAYTHPNDSEHDFFTAEVEDTMTIRPNFDYYDTGVGTIK